MTDLLMHQSMLSSSPLCCQTIFTLHMHVLLVEHDDVRSLVCEVYFATSS